jgi:hypothetical protein
MVTGQFVFCVNPVGFTETLRLPGVVPLAGLTVTHVHPAVALKLIAAPALLLRTETLCATGAEPPNR